MVTVMPAHRLQQILHVGDLSALRRAAEIGCQLVELARPARIPIRLGSLRRSLQVRRDLLRHLLEFRRIRLLQLLQRAHQLSEWRELLAIRL